jgi:hypothetical protein
MATEQFANNASSTLNGAINNSVTSITVTDGSSFPSVGNFRLVCESEIMICTARSGNTLTVQRGQEGTTAASHADTTAIIHILTKNSFAQAFSDRVVIDTWANLPSAGLAGRKFIATDSPLSALDDGAAWHYFCNGFKVTPPSLGDFSWVNQGTASSDTTKGGVIIKDAAGGGAHNIRALVKSIPSAPYTIVIGFYGWFMLGQFSLLGPVWRNSSSGKIDMIRIGNDNTNLNFLWEHFDNATTHNSNVVQSQMNENGGQPFFIKLEDDNTNLKVYFSNNPFYFPYSYGSISRTAFFTPDQAGFCVNPHSQNTAIQVIHYKENP